MEIVEARVRNFRSIEDTGWVDINEDITTLLGPNESGKTSFLKAIHHFGNKQKYDDSDINKSGKSHYYIPIPIVELKLIITKNSKFRILTDSLAERETIRVGKYSNGVKRIILGETHREADSGFYNENYMQALLNGVRDLLNELPKSSIHASSQLIDDSIKELNDINYDVDFLSSIPKELPRLLKSLQRTVQVKKYEKQLGRAVSQLELEISQASEEFVRAQEIRPYLPSFVYHNSASLLSDEIGINEVDSQEHKTFKNLLEICGVDYTSFKNMSKRERSEATEQIETTIQGDINELWEQKTVDITVDYDSGEFIVSLKDTELNCSSDLNRSLVAPSQRSRGFQWFLSFYINLTASGKSESKNTVMLLDDPAVFLHPEGKRNWLEAIEEIADGNQVLYTSHSPYLIRKEYPSRIRIVEDREEERTIISGDFLESDEMSLEPLRKALGIGLGDSPFAAKRKILVEGPSDYYILTGLANYFKEYLDRDIISWEEVTIFPVGGADKMVQASKWVMSEGFSYAILLDNDEKGGGVIDRLQDEAPTVEDERVFKLERDDEHQNYHIEIEDMFRTEFYIDCVNTAYNAELGEFEPIEVSDSEDGDGVSIENETYKQRKIVSKLDDILEDRGHGELDKSLVAREIQDRLTGGNAKEEDVKQFNALMEKLRRIMPR